MTFVLALAGCVMELYNPVLCFSLGQCVRELSGLNEAKDVKMIDTIHAVVLCGRELYIYNLDNGQVKSKLKGRSLHHIWSFSTLL